MIPKLTMVHLQLTLSCNLRCAFCGQHHMSSHSSVDWFGILHQLHDYAPGCRVVLWGGEPLLYPQIDELCKTARQLEFPLELITNGTLFADHMDILRNAFEHIYVSVDGPAEIHNRIRGRGVFEKVRSNIELLRGGRAKISLQGVLTPQTMPFAKEVPYGLNVDHAILHELIGFSDEERQAIPETKSWPELPASYHGMLMQTIQDLKERAFAVPVEFQPHFYGGTPCREPFRHLHIHADGETSFCTDFSPDSLGNVLQKSIRDIFEGEQANRFRAKGNTPFCSHCSWKNTEETIVPFSTGISPSSSPNA